MTTDETRQAIESILMVADQPVEASVLAQLLEVSKASIEQACADLAAEYEMQGRGFVLAAVAGGYRFQSHPDLAPYVERFVLDGQTSRLSSAALETLAIVAYKQPISRMQIAAIRGVNVDGVLRTLTQRGYVEEVSRDPGPGNAVLFGTTSLFLERVGLHSLDDLPALAEFVPGADVVEALEEGLRPEPLPELTDTPDADVVSAAHSRTADDQAAGAEADSDEPADPDLGHPPGAGGADSDAAFDAAVDGAALEGAAADGAVGEESGPAREPEPDVDLTTHDQRLSEPLDAGRTDHVTVNPGEVIPLAHDAAEVTLRHDLPPGAEDPAEPDLRPNTPQDADDGSVPFRSAPGIGGVDVEVPQAHPVGPVEGSGGPTSIPSVGGEGGPTPG